MGGRIDIYLDIVSFYSYIAFADLLQNLDKLAANGVEVDFHPVFLGAIVQMSGNKPPWTNEFKGKYLQREFKWAVSRVGLEGLASPPDLMARARTASALRALYFIKANYPRATFLSAVHCLMDRIWRPPHGDIVGDEGLATGLAEVTAAPGNGGPKLFTEDDVRRIMEGRESMKDVLTAQTTKAHKELGAFGAPWLCVTNDEGQKEVFFGSDRFNHVYRHLGIPFQDITVLAPAKL